MNEGTSPSFRQVPAGDGELTAALHGQRLVVLQPYNAGLWVCLHLHLDGVALVDLSVDCAGQVGVEAHKATL